MLATLLPIFQLISPLILWGLKMFITNKATSQRMTNSWKRFIKQDDKEAGASVDLHDSYDEQVAEHEKADSDENRKPE